jgi:hypothetical protein
MLVVWVQMVRVEGCNHQLVLEGMHLVDRLGIVVLVHLLGWLVERRV